TSRSGAGNRLLKAIKEFDLVILNDGSPTLIHHSAQNSVIDLSLSSPVLAPICSSHVLDDTFGSDHFPICTKINVKPCYSKKFCYKLKLNKDQLTTLNYMLRNSVNEISGKETLDVTSQYNLFVEHVQSTARGLLPQDKGVPHSKINSCRLKSSPWWNDDCDTAVKDRRKALRELVECPDRARLDNFKSARKRCTECIQEAKRIGWRKGSFNCKTSTHRIWSLIKSFRRNKNPTLNQGNNLDTVSLAAIEKLCPPFCPYNDTKHIEDMKREDLLQNNTQQWLEEPFSRVELTRAISVAKKRSRFGSNRSFHHFQFA
ncbi:hypothetical protein ALC57_18279, partial [Trachymyrmex cornetzi]